jgi:hypothetical protein
MAKRTNEFSKPRSVNGNFGTSDLRRTTYPVKTKKKQKKNKDQISDDQAKPRRVTLNAPGSAGAGSAWTREDP